jgi:L-ascorbate metabolism protein UlaG (beta-lactamase superfamily)
MKLTWFGHSAFRIEYGGAVVMLDPFLANPTWKGDHKAAYAGATHVILSHGHGDHIGSTVEICRDTGAALVANPEITDHLSEGGEIAVVEAFNHGSELQFKGFSVASVPAWHSSSREAEGGKYLGNPGGIVLMSPQEKTLYFAGDTGIFGDMALINELYSPKVGILPIGDRYTMGARLAAFACKRFFDFDAVIPCHYGTFDLPERTPDRFIAEMAGSRTKVLVPERGLPVEL